jgi:type I restriction enzyme M protein
MFVYSERFIEAHGGKRGQVAVYGQELSADTRKLACMNLAIRGIDYDLGKKYGDTFHDDQHPDLRADTILANPPFNIRGWGADKLTKDSRWKHGLPPDGNANYAWLQHMAARLSADGRAGIVLSNGSLTSTNGGEDKIRASMVKGDLVECMVALPGQLFANTQIPACLWFLSKNKAPGKRGSADRRKQVLFIDASKLASLIPGSRKQKQLSDDEIQQIASTYHNWRGTQWGDGEYSDVPGFCQSVELDEIEKHDFALTPGRYVGAEEIEDDEQSFNDRMEALTGELSELLASGANIERDVRLQLSRVGYVL